MFLPSGVWGITVKQLEPDVCYRAFLFNPVDGSEHDLGEVTPDAAGSWKTPGSPPLFQDYVLVLEGKAG